MVTSVITALAPYVPVVAVIALGWVVCSVVVHIALRPRKRDWIDERLDII